MQRESLKGSLMCAANVLLALFPEHTKPITEAFDGADGPFSWHEVTEMCKNIVITEATWTAALPEGQYIIHEKLDDLPYGHASGLVVTSMGLRLLILNYERGVTTMCEVGQVVGCPITSPNV